MQFSEFWTDENNEKKLLLTIKKDFVLIFGLILALPSIE